MDIINPNVNNNIDISNTKNAEQTPSANGIPASQSVFAKLFGSLFSSTNANDTTDVQHKHHHKPSGADAKQTSSSDTQSQISQLEDEIEDIQSAIDKLGFDPKTSGEKAFLSDQLSELMNELETLQSNSQAV